MEAKHETPSIAFPPQLLAAIDAAATEEGWSRSLLIREAVKGWLRMKGYPTTVDADRKSA